MHIDEYRRFLELDELLDHDLSLKLAHWAAVHSDPDIREAGEDFLERSAQARTDVAGEPLP